MSPDLAQRYEKLRRLITVATTESGRSAGSVRLIAMSKGHPGQMVLAAISAGIRRFGENRVQEAERKFAALRQSVPDLELHLTGPLQTNKVRAAVALFDVIHTLDRPKLADALADVLAGHSRRPRLLVQVNTGAEPQKAGIAPHELGGFLAYCTARKLKVEGLMCLPPVHEPAGPHFKKLAALAREHALSELSMGMSADFTEAIAAGATCIRVGTALFGSREEPADL